eukprot:UN07401
MNMSAQQHFSINNALIASSLKQSPIAQYYGNTNGSLMETYINNLKNNYGKFAANLALDATAPKTNATGTWLSHALTNKRTSNTAAFDVNNNFGHKLFYTKSLAHSQ